MPKWIHDHTKMTWCGTFQEVTLKVKFNKVGSDVWEPPEYHWRCEGVPSKIKDWDESRRIELRR